MRRGKRFFVAVFTELFKQYYASESKKISVGFTKEKKKRHLFSLIFIVFDMSGAKI